MQTSRLDVQLEALGIAFERLEEGLPRSPLPKPSLPVLAKVNGDVAFCILSETSIISHTNLPSAFMKLEAFGSDKQRSLAKNLGLQKMTVLCQKSPVFLDRRLIDRPSIVLPVGDKTHYLLLKTADFIKAIGDTLVVTDYPQLLITPDEYLDGSDFSRARVRNAMNNMTSLPPFPVTARSIIELSQNPNFDIDQLVHVIERDAPIASSLLSWANSAGLSGGRSELSSVASAISRLGTVMTMNYAMQASMLSSFRTTKDLSPLVQFACYNSLHSAYGAKLMCEKDGVNDSHESYLAGLMYNLGELLLVQCFPERAKEYLITQEINPHLSREVVSRELFKVSFASSTDLLMANWNMPRSIAAAARALASYEDNGDNQIASYIRQWQLLMLDAGLMSYAHAPRGWDLTPKQPDADKVIQGAESKINEFMTFSLSVTNTAR